MRDGKMAQQEEQAIARGYTREQLLQQENKSREVNDSAGVVGLRC